MLDKVDLIKTLRMQLLDTQEPDKRDAIREKISQAITDKQNAFKQSAKDDEDFMMLS